MPFILKQEMILQKHRDPKYFHTLCLKKVRPASVVTLLSLWPQLMPSHASGHRLPGPELRVPGQRRARPLGGDTEMSSASDSAVAQTVPSLIKQTMSPQIIYFVTLLINNQN